MEVQYSHGYLATIFMSSDYYYMNTSPQDACQTKDTAL